MCGYFRGASSLPYPLRYANYGLITYYGAEVLAINEFHDLDIDCEASQAVNGTHLNGHSHPWPRIATCIRCKTKH
jgi:hypothetical protein